MPLPSHFDEGGAQFAWDSTSLKAAYTCPRLYYYQMIEHRVPHSSSVHLIFGGHYAKAVERYHKFTISEAMSHDEACVEVVRLAMVESWVHNLTKEGEPRPGTGAPQEFLSSSKTRENLIRTIVWYLEEFRHSDFKTYIRASGEPAVEYSFKLEVDNNLVFCGHNDRVLDYGSALLIQDQKTTGGTATANSFEAYDLDIQMSLYTFAGRLIFSTPIKGVMIDIAQVAVGFSRFLRGFTYRTEAQLEEWYEQSMRKIAEIRGYTISFRETGDPAAFPMNYTACGNYGGCPFRTVCRQSPQFRKKFLESNFTRREPWNPLESR